MAGSASGCAPSKRAPFLLAATLLLGLLTPVGPLVASPAGAQSAPPTSAAAGFDGDPATTERLVESHPVYAAVEISRLRFAGAGAATGVGTTRLAAHVVLSRDDNFADSVAGSSLTDDGPLLLTPRDNLHPATAAEIQRVLGPTGRVILLGGPNAISAAVEQDLRNRGFTTERLAGATRIETAVAVARAVRARHPGSEVLLARAWGPTGNDTAAWADSVAGGAFAAKAHIPILVTRTDSLDPPVAAWLASDQPATTTLLGGDAALSAAVFSAVPNPRRVSGADRTATAAAIATQLWRARSTGARRFVVGNASNNQGWAFGFSSAGLAADAQAPVLLITSKVTEPTTSLTSTCGPPQVDMLVVGDGVVVPAPLREQLDAADGYACGPGGRVVYPTNLDGFPECAAVLDHFRNTALEHVGAYGLGGYGDYFGGGVVPTPGPGGAPPPQPARDESAPSPGEAPGSPSPGTDGGSSGTNVQEEGVDEPDIVKTNATHLFQASGDEVRIVDISGAVPRLASRLPLETGASHELLLSGTRLLVVDRQFGFFTGGPQPQSSSPAFAPETGRTTTRITSVDVSDPARPTILSTLEIEGDYRSARMVGSVARVVIQSDPGPWNFEFPQTAGAEAEHQAAEHNRQVVRDSTLDDWLPSYAVTRGDGQVTDEGPLVECDDVRTPPIFSGLGTLSVITVDVAGAINPTSSAAVIASGDTVYASTSRLFVSTGRWGWEPDALNAGPTTELHGFDISNPAATAYTGSGLVPGYILNQFALSEFNGDLRVATTSEPPWRDQGTPIPSESGVHVLAEQGGSLVEVGRVRGLGKGERIKAVRFFGEIAAVVTFRQIDPLFLLDLSIPSAPRVTGELKIPGFSAYLHRVGPDRLLGVGRQATSDGRVTGAQVSLFDIADKSTPRLVGSLEYPDGQSIVEFDHHAFLFWPATSLAVVPISEFSPSGPGFFGAVGIRVGSPGLSEVGRATHADDASQESDPQITRSFVSNGNLFTASDAGIESNDLATLQERSFLAL